MQRIILIIIAVAMLAVASIEESRAQVPMGMSDRHPDEPISWRGSARMTSADEGIIKITATIADGWHLYGTEMPDGGPKPTAISFTLPKGLTLIGKLTPQRAPLSKKDAMSSVQVQYWEGSVTFTQKFRLAPQSAPAKAIPCAVSYMGCNNQTCLPPKTKKLSLKILPKK